MASRVRHVIFSGFSGIKQSLGYNADAAYAPVIDLDDFNGPSHRRTGSAHSFTKAASRPGFWGISIRQGWFVYSMLVTLLAVFLYRRIPPVVTESQASTDTGRVFVDPVKAQHPPLTSFSTEGGRPPRRKAVILSGENATLSRQFPSGWEVRSAYNSTLDRPKSAALPFLDFIIHNYRSLPGYMVFAHGETRSWHQPAPLPDLVRALDLAALEKHGWLNLRCSLTPSCKPSTTWVNTTHVPPGEEFRSYLVRGIYYHIYQTTDIWFPVLNPPPSTAGLLIPPIFAAPAGSQFAVTNAKVWSKPLEFWVRVREPLLNPPETMSWWWPDRPFTAAQIDLAYEHLWQYLFLGKPVVCLEEDYCRQVVFQDKIHCRGEDLLTPESSQAEVEALQCAYHG